MLAHRLAPWRRAERARDERVRLRDRRLRDRGATRRAFRGGGASRHWWDAAARGTADALIPVADWINANTKPGDVIAVDGEPFIYLYTGRTVVPVHILSPDEYFAGTPVEQAAADLRVLIAAGHPTYAIFSARRR